MVPNCHYQCKAAIASKFCW